MREIEKEIVGAMLACRSGSLSKRDTVIAGQGSVTYVLWNTPVVKWYPGERKVLLNAAGWRTATTRSRINGILRGLGIDATVYQSGFVWYVSGGPSGTPKPFIDGMSIEY